MRVSGVNRNCARLACFSLSAFSTLLVMHWASRGSGRRFSDAAVERRAVQSECGARSLDGPEVLHLMVMDVQCRGLTSEGSGSGRRDVGAKALDLDLDFRACGGREFYEQYKCSPLDGT